MDILNPNARYQLSLTDEEADVLEKSLVSFLRSDFIQRHPHKDILVELAEQMLEAIQGEMRERHYAKDPDGYLSGLR